MQESNLSMTIVLIATVMISMVLSLAFVQCSEKRANEKVQAAELSEQKAQEELSLLKEENEKLHGVLKRANDAIDRAEKAVTNARGKDEERVQEIQHSSDASDWLSCELPDSVRDAFRDYCQDTDIATTENTCNAM